MTPAPQAPRTAPLRDGLAARLLAARGDDGLWRGRLSGSALATAVAAAALHAADPRRSAPRVAAALDWIARHRHGDGSWGDTPESPGNLSTTLLAWCALGLHPGAHTPEETAAGRWLAERAGDTTPARLAAAVLAAYGEDRTFSAPILAMAAAAGRLGPGPAGWRHVPQLPFELAALPPGLFRALRLQVVSYALPALIAIGLVRHRCGPRAPGPAPALRDPLVPSLLRRLQRTQPANGGFLEAAPLTGFVVLALATAGLRAHPVVRRGVSFLETGMRADGSWPVDTDLATWLTALAVDALPREALPAGDRIALRQRLLGLQTGRRHPFTGAAPGGWGWTDRPGAVPDADDTAGALLALHALGRDDRPSLRAAVRGVHWLLGLQNRDGGMPTFCRGWGRLPFDRSGPDLTAHALRAWAAWMPALPPGLRRRAARASGAALRYLAGSQRDDGAWLPLWFGNQSAPRTENPVFGTARVLRALRDMDGSAGTVAMGQRGTRWLLAQQHADGGWGAAAGVAPTVEETAAALSALAGVPGAGGAVERGQAWLDAAWRDGPPPAAPIGLYFARLWYAEALYPLVFSVAAAGADA